MSAWIVSKYHIDAILTAYKQWSPDKPDFDALDALGQKLTNENYKSVNHRYDTDEAPPKYEFKLTAPHNPLQIVKAAHCLDYQSCEHAGWKRSKAKKFLERMVHIAVSRHPEYEKSEWGMEARE